jgi:hypothetical protein
MTKKHYEAIAKDINNAYNHAGNLATVSSQDKAQNAIRLLTLSLCNTFITDNKNFNRDKFLTACGVEFTPEPS